MKLTLDISNYDKQKQTKKQMMILSTFIHWFYSFVEYVRYFMILYIQNYKHFFLNGKWEKIQRFNFVWDHHFVNLKIKWIINQFLKAYMEKQTFFHENSSEFSPSFFLNHLMKTKKILTYNSGD